MAKKERIEVISGAFLMIVLILLLVVGLAAKAASAPVRAETAVSVAVEFDDCAGPIIAGRTARFVYRDDGYDQVYVQGDFTDWDPEPMDLDVDGCWALEMDLDRGLHRYQFLVDDGVEEWTVVDPGNEDAQTYRDHGWVSTFRIGRAPGTRKPSRERRISYRRSISPPMSRELSRGHPDGDFGADYNRVDGFQLQWMPRSYTGERMGPVLQGLFRYGFASEEWTLGGTFLQPLLPNHALMLKLGAFGGTDYNDNTGVSDVENMLAAVFFKEDDRDYFEREGASLSLILSPCSWLRVEGGYRADDYASLENNADWSFAGGDFLPNPAIHEGHMRGVFGNLRLGTPANHIRLGYDLSDPDRFGGDFDFSRLTAAYRGRVELGRAQRFDVQVKYGTALEGVLPNQHRFAMGGIGTVRGYRYQSLITRDPAAAGDPLTAQHPGGQRMLQLNLEYGLTLGWGGWDLSDEIEEWGEWDEGDWDDIDFSEVGSFDGRLFVFYDSGMAWEDRHAEVSFDDCEASIGVGYQFGEDGLRLDVARPIEGDDTDPIFQLRCNRMF